MGFFQSCVVQTLHCTDVCIVFQLMELTSSVVSVTSGVSVGKVEPGQTTSVTVQLIAPKHQGADCFTSHSGVHGVCMYVCDQHHDFESF